MFVFYRLNIFEKTDVFWKDLNILGFSSFRVPVLVLQTAATKAFGLQFLVGFLNL